MRRGRKEKICMLFGSVLLCATLMSYFSVSVQHNFNRLARNLLTEYSYRQQYAYLESDIPDTEATTIKPIKLQNHSRATTQSKTTPISKGSDIEARFHRRKKMLQETCSRYSKRLTNPPECEVDDAGFNLKYVNESDLVYCAIEKAGSTFWKRILHVIGGWSNDSNPISIKSEDADSKHGGFETLKNSTLLEMHEVFNMSNSLMFVRDPYTRLFSAWLDKFYSPNPYYWSNLGPSIVRFERPGKDNITAPAPSCPSDISFKEFLNYTIKTIIWKPCVDGHFAPNYQHCLPCLMPFDYIGKYETFKEDTYHLLEKFNLSDKVKFDDFEGDAALDAIRDSTEWIFSQKENIKDCNVTFHCALFKLWNRLQSRGILSKTIVFPYNNTGNVLNITKDEFASVLKKANQESDPEEIKKNRKEALHQAFQILPSVLKRKLGTAFHLDFSMFGYDRSPSYFDVTNEISHNYFEECQETEE